MKSPLRYPGGKTRACDKLDEILKDYFDVKQISIIISPFLGGASFEFYLQSKYGFKLIANDKFKPLYTFWKLCKEQNEELCRILYENINKIEKENFIELREKIMDQENLDQAVSYFIINRCSFSGATLSGGFSLEASKKRFTKSSIDRVKQLDLKNVELSCLDFEDFLDRKQKDNEIIFLDPPYYLEKGSKLYGQKGDLHDGFNHKKLKEILSKKDKWIMTYNDCSFIKDLYKDYTILDVDWTYGMNSTKKSSEIVIIKR